MTIARFLISLSLLAGCSNDAGAAGTGSSDGPDGETAVADARVAPERDASTSSMRDAGKLDAAKSHLQECTPGHYEGEFNCLISGLLPWVGKIAFDLVEETMGAGEFTTLMIVPGTKIMGANDNLSGMFTAELAGTFDCTTGKLGGSLEDGVYTLGTGMDYRLMGPLQGDYASDGGAPGFSGMMGPLTDPDFDVFGGFAPTASCTWNAAHSAGDAGN